MATASSCTSPVLSASHIHPEDFSVTQLLNLINLARETGTLVVESPVNVISVSFREGKLAYAQDGNENDNRITVLHRFNRLSSAH